MSDHPAVPAAAYQPGFEHDTKGTAYDEKTVGSDQAYGTGDVQNGELKRHLQGRHMQMIAIGGAIGAGLFVGSGGALANGGPASLIICFLIIGGMLLLTLQALAELTVLYPVNGAFFTYATRFINRAWGFAIGWNYAIEWLTVLPFEITAASITIQYWPSAQGINQAVWIVVFLIALSFVQVFGIRGYGETEFVLSLIKVTAIIGFIILGIIIDTGGVPGSPEGYIGNQYFGADYNYGFANGFSGFCSVFVTASFAYSGTELVGLAAAEAADPLKTIPAAVKQVFWRVAICYVGSLTIVGLLVPDTAGYLINASGANTKASPFVKAIENAGINGLPSVMNVVICLSVLSVANSCAFGSTRTMQALATEGMAPRFLQKIDKHGRPIYCVIIQLLFGLLAFVGLSTSTAGLSFFGWLLALSGLANFFIWGSICFAHIRFRKAWAVQGHSVDEIPYKASFGTTGSWIGLGMNMLCLAATFYSAIWAPGAGITTPPSEAAYVFFENYLAAPVTLCLYLGWKIYTRDWTLFIRSADMDITTGLRSNVYTPEELRAFAEERERKKGLKHLPMKIIRAVI